MLVTRRLLAISCLVLLACFDALGQTSRGTITGIVKDPSGAVVPKARIELVNVGQNSTRSTESNDTGLYRFDAVDPGDYQIKVSLAGFSTFETSPFPIAAAQVATIDATLETGQTVTTVNVADVSVSLQTEAPVRAATIAPVQATELPVALRNPALLALTIPGVSSNRGGFGTSTFPVNGSRGRSNNFLLDGTENNDISITGQALRITNPDAVAEVSVQTSNYDAEFGRAGGAVVNTITKSGTNEFHGTASYLVESTRFNAMTNQESLNAEVRRRGRPLPGTDQYFSGTLGGPILRNKTFFFGAFQENRTLSSSTASRIHLSAAGRATLRALYPVGTRPNVDLYLANTEGAVATTQLAPLALGDGRPNLEFGTVARSFSNFFESTLPMVKVDHRFNDTNLLMARWAWDDRQNTGTVGTAPGFDTTSRSRFLNLLVSYTRVFSPTVTNELRLPYNRPTLSSPNDAENPLAGQIPNIDIGGFQATTLGVASTLPQGRVANNYGLQDTITVVQGRHSLRFGLDLLLQRARQFAPVAHRGDIAYRASTGYTAFANFIDDFGGSGGGASKDFGSPAYYPSLFRQAYFFQDRWRVTNNLTMTLGARYEYFGLPMNSLRTPAFTGLFNIDPRTFTGPFTEPNRVPADRNNWAPVAGLAWSPSFTEGVLGKLLGDKQFVVRAGYQIGYDSFFNNIASNAATAAPNIIATNTPSVVTAANPRGLPNMLASLPRAPRPLTPLDSQGNLVASNLVNPYYQRWSFGIQRNLPFNFLLDTAYVGSRGVKLYANEDLNPLVPPAFQIMPQGLTEANVPYRPLQGRYDNLQGARTIRTNNGNSSYHSLQIDARRRFANGLMFSGAYTWSKFMDNASEVFNWNGFQIPASPAIPSIFGGQPLEKSVSAFDRTQRAVFTWVYELPFYKKQRGVLGHLAGGWQASGVATFESGVPFTVVNGLDADGFGGGFDRPLFNPSGAPGVRAQVSTTSPTGYINPDNGNAPINPQEARFIQLPTCNFTRNPSGCPTGNLGRNTERSKGTNNVNMNFKKRTAITEQVTTELWVEFFNIFNHPQYGLPGEGAFQPASPAMQSNVATSPAGRFLRPEFQDGGARVARFGFKLRF